MAKGQKKKYVKLGDKAYGFSDPWSRFNISKGQVKELSTLEHRRSKKIKNALAGGHLQNATGEEFETYQESLVIQTEGGKVTKPEPSEEEILREELEAKTKEGLADYYDKNYEVTPEDIKTFSKLKHEEMVDELLSLFTENPD